MSLNIENTNIAFRSKSNAQLRRSYWLYKLLNSPFLVKIGQAVVQTALNLHLPVEGIIRATVFRQFCGGETIEQCQGTIEALAQFNIGTVLDYSVEGGQKEVDFNYTTAEILRTVDLAAKNRNIAFCVFKVSGIAPFWLLEKKNSNQPLTPNESSEWDKVKERVHSICSRAHAYGVRLFIDAEETWIQNTIDQLAERMMAEFNQQQAIIYNTLQMYRNDRLPYLQSLLGRAQSAGFKIGLKIVRGAYMEKERAWAQTRGMPSPIWATKAESDQAYDQCLAFCVERLATIALCAGTHNESSTQLLARLMEQKQIPRSDVRIFFSQLLGMGDHLSYNLANEGFNVAKYVPYGPVRSVMPYLFRRAKENTSVKGQTSRELGLIVKELAQRKRQSSKP